MAAELLGTYRWNGGWGIDSWDLILRKPGSVAHELTNLSSEHTYRVTGFGLAIARLSRVTVVAAGDRVAFAGREK